MIAFSWSPSYFGGTDDYAPIFAVISEEQEI